MRVCLHLQFTGRICLR